jgi:hypothetical protein
MGPKNYWEDGMNFGRKFARVAAIAAVFAMAPVAAQAQNFINVLTGGTAGVYYPLGVAISKIFTDKIKDSRPSRSATRSRRAGLAMPMPASAASSISFAS